MTTINEREIKFRAWEYDTQRMIYESDIVFHDGTAYASKRDYEDCISIDMELMQYTGLKDKAGVEIYEGDIIKRCVAIHQGGIKEYSIGEVYFETPCFVIKNYSKSKYANKCVPLKILFDNTVQKDEVIGNIYKNKELLND